MIKVDYAVVIVTYNRAVLLRECVSQVEKQTVPAVSQEGLPVR